MKKESTIRIERGYLRHIAARPDSYGADSARLASFAAEILTWVLENRTATIPSIRVHEIARELTTPSSGAQPQE